MVVMPWQINVFSEMYKVAKCNFFYKCSQSTRSVPEQMLYIYGRTQEAISFFIQQIYSNNRHSKVFSPVCFDHYRVSDQQVRMKHSHQRVYTCIVFKCFILILLRDVMITFHMMQGAKDPLQNAPRRAKEMKRLCENVKVVLVEAGHCPFDEAPEFCNTELLKFMGSLPRAQPAAEAVLSPAWPWHTVPWKGALQILTQWVALSGTCWYVQSRNVMWFWAQKLQAFLAFRNWSFYFKSGLRACLKHCLENNSAYLYVRLMTVESKQENYICDWWRAWFSAYQRSMPLGNRPNEIDLVIVEDLPSFQWVCH